MPRSAIKKAIEEFDINDEQKTAATGCAVASLIDPYGRGL
jgi:hypothetical protein